MIPTNQIAFLLCISWALLVVYAAPDSAGYVPTPAPGLVYGGIPYGSMSGNVADFFRRQPPSSPRSGNHAAFSAGGPENSLEVNYAPIEQYL